MIDCTLPISDDPLQQIESTLQLLNKIEEEAGSRKSITLNMENTSWMTPFVTLMLSSKILEVRKNGFSVSVINPKLDRVSSFLNRVGFPFGEEEHLSNQSYFPIRHFSSEPDKIFAELSEYIKEKFPEQIKGNCINFLIAELIDNIDQHSKYKHASVMAQYFPLKGFVDIGVIDNGVSIPALFNDYHISFTEDWEAIKLALEGTSTKNEEGRGTGLPKTSLITTERLKGEYYIFSRKGAIHINSLGEKKAYNLRNIPLKGTIVYLRFKVPNQKIDIYQDLS